MVVSIFIFVGTRGERRREAERKKRGVEKKDDVYADSVGYRAKQRELTHLKQSKMYNLSIVWLNMQV
jgi:hypothetical protein